MAGSKQSELYFDGTGDIAAFLEKAELLVSLKGIKSEDKAKYIASKLGLNAFDVYRRLSAEDKKDAEKIKGQLLKEFCTEERNRDEALSSLMNCTRSPTETPQSFAYKVSRLVTLAYSTLPVTTRDIIAKDYFVNSLSKELPVALKSLEKFVEKDLNALSNETTRLEIAGVTSKSTICMVNPGPDITDKSKDDLVESITESVMEKLNINFNSFQPTRQQGRFNGNRTRGSSRGSRRGGYQNKTCRVCKSSGHLFRNCPERYCQACASKGHDAWNPSCPNYS